MHCVAFLMIVAECSVDAGVVRLHIGGGYEIVGA